MIRTLLLFTIFGLLSSSCGIVKRGTVPWEEQKKTKTVQTAMSVARVSNASSASTGRLSKSEKAIKSSLDLAYKDWKGIPYVLGGTGYNGVDCSSFMQIVFADYFEIDLPRNTREQMREGSSVKRKKIRMGDLVFFKTGRRLYHVGVMINNEQFLHASTSSGVMISGLQEKYWKDKYHLTRRIF